MNLTIGIDLGGTRIKGVLLNADTGDVLEQHTTSTNDGAGQVWQTGVTQTVDALRQAATHPIAGIGLAAPGLPNVANTTIACMPGRLQGLENFDWSALLGAPVRVLNDAHAALLAEARFGAARQCQNVVMLTLGTGVGGGLLLNGELYQGFFQMAGHLGHMTVDADSDQLDITNTPGSLEDAIGNATVSRRSFGRYQSTYALLDGYRQNEPLATLVWLTSVRRLAAAIASLANAFSPERVVLGGGITQADDALFLPLQTFMEPFAWKPGGKEIPIIKARFADWAGAIGAASSRSNQPNKHGPY